MQRNNGIGFQAYLAKLSIAPATTYAFADRTALKITAYTGRLALPSDSRILFFVCLPPLTLFVMGLVSPTRTPHPRRHRSVCPVHQPVQRRGLRFRPGPAQALARAHRRYVTHCWLCGALPLPFTRFLAPELGALALLRSPPRTRCQPVLMVCFAQTRSGPCSSLAQSIPTWMVGDWLGILSSNESGSSLISPCVLDTLVQELFPTPSSARMPRAVLWRPMVRLCFVAQRGLVRLFSWSLCVLAGQTIYLP